MAARPREVDVGFVDQNDRVGGLIGEEVSISERGVRVPVGLLGLQM